MNKRPHYVLALGVASLIGSAALLLAGGGTAVVGVMQLAEHHLVGLAVAFAAWALLANCLILPAGSLSLIAGGAVLGLMLPAAIWFAAQLLTAPLLYRMTRTEPQRISAMVDRYLGAPTAALVARAASDGIWTTIVLRLTPVLPSAPATLIAAASGIPLRSFAIGSLLAGWLRPVYFSSLGATAGSLAKVGTAHDAIAFATIWPAAALSICALVILGLRLWLARREFAGPPAIPVAGPDG